MKFSASAFVFLIVLHSQVRPQSGEVPSPPLQTDSLSTIIHDLEQFIPAHMEQRQVLGLALALIRDNQIAWTRGYGLANSISREPVTPQTVFSVASLGKAVTAYAAMKFVAEGKLVLDRPLYQYLNEPWLPHSADHDAITARHALTHTSGLSNFLRDEKKRLKFAPGKQFAYSGIGFMYLQAALERISNSTLV
ncbi:MAG: serine hydrolase domain-containing protein [bacterium]